MLNELYIHNFAVIEEMQLKFGHGLTVISGEEGAGKSLIVDALSMLMGARTDSSLIRDGTSMARVEGVFWLLLDNMERLNNILQKNAIDPEADGMLVISRELQQQGRSIARVNRKVVPLSLLKQIGYYLLDVHGQMDHISLLDSHHQLDLVDSYGNLAELRNGFVSKLNKFREKDKELISVQSEENNGRQELLRYQIDEIEQAKLKLEEDQSLQNKREILLNAEVLKNNCLSAFSSLYSEERSATVQIHEALVALRGLNNNDTVFLSYKEKMEDAIVNLEEIARELRQYGESIEADMYQFEEIEQRLNLLADLKRKYGANIENILDFHSKAKSELESVENFEGVKNNLQKERKCLEVETGKLAEELSLSRRQAAKSLAATVNEELADIGLTWAKFDIHLYREENVTGLPITGGKRFKLTGNGIDHVEFVVATNPGESMRPLATIASGGETCRIMLAVKSALKRIDPIPTLIFDEIDAGVGGRSGNIIGKKLTSLALRHQVICITHLPHIACFGDEHIRLIKDTVSGRASTLVETVTGKRRIEELAAMLGSESAGKAMLAGADKLLDQALSWKQLEKDKVTV